MSGYTIAWLAWGGAFALTETLALVNRRSNDTLSEQTRLLFRVSSSPAGRLVFGLGWGAFSTWFLGHILQWWR